jgi:hypothetical protein
VARGIHGIGGEFLKGINIHAPESRDFCTEIIDFLRRTPIEWVRIHPLPSRRLRARGPSGISHLEAIEKYAEAGFNLIIPIDVGVKENVGVISRLDLRKFVDESYGHSFKAVKQIETKIAKYNRSVIYGVENEIDTKEWILQSMPSVGWRGSPLAWFRLSVNKDLKSKRLNHILAGINEASPNALTMVNFEADDPVEDWNSQISLILGAQTVFSKMGLLQKDARHRMNNYRLDVFETIRSLKHFDIIGLDNYPNYFTKIPPKGHNIGSKVDYVARQTRKPVINVEFGYSTEGKGIKRRGALFRQDQNNPQLQLLSPEQLQKRFFVNALGSVENSSSQGTFPWVLYLELVHYYKPVEEIGFSLMKLGSNRILQPTASLDYYLNWLESLDPHRIQSHTASSEKSAATSVPEVNTKLRPDLHSREA